MSPLVASEEDLEQILREFVSPSLAPDAAGALGSVGVRLVWDSYLAFVRMALEGHDGYVIVEDVAQVEAWSHDETSQVSLEFGRQISFARVGEEDGDVSHTLDGGFSFVLPAGTALAEMISLRAPAGADCESVEVADEEGYDGPLATVIDEFVDGLPPRLLEEAGVSSNLGVSWAYDAR